MFDVDEQVAAAHAREQYASRWIEFQASVEPIPMDFPMSRQTIMDTLFGAGTAESARA